MAIDEKKQGSSKAKAIRSIASKGFVGPAHNVSRYLKYADMDPKSFDEKERIEKNVLDAKGKPTGQKEQKHKANLTANEWAKELYESGTGDGKPFRFGKGIYTIAVTKTPAQYPSFDGWLGKIGKGKFKSKTDAIKAYELEFAKHGAKANIIPQPTVSVKAKAKKV